jgi:hypothetical protein
MKVFVATKRLQGLRKNDFSHTLEGELVKYGFVCDGETVDGHCGCMRSMVGFESQKATTTFKVVEMPITPEEFWNKYIESERKAGWVKESAEKADLKVFKAVAKELLKLASHFQVDTVLEKRGYRIQTRVPIVKKSQ